MQIASKYIAMGAAVFMMLMTCLGTVSAQDPFEPTTSMSALDVIGQPDFVTPTRDPQNTPLNNAAFNVSRASLPVTNQFVINGSGDAKWDSTDRMLYVMDTTRRGVLLFHLPVGLEFSQANLVYKGVIGQADETGTVVNFQGTNCAGDVGVNGCNLSTSPRGVDVFTVPAGANPIHVGKRVLAVADGFRRRVLFFDVTNASTSFASGPKAIDVLGQNDLTTGGGANLCADAVAFPLTASACRLGTVFSLVVANDVLMVAGNLDRSIAYKLSDFGTGADWLKGDLVLGHPDMRADAHNGQELLCDGVTNAGPRLFGVDFATIDGCTHHTPVGMVWSESERQLLIMMIGRILVWDFSSSSGSLFDALAAAKTASPTPTLSADYVIGQAELDTPHAIRGKSATDEIADSRSMAYDEAGNRLFVRERCVVRIYDFTAGLKATFTPAGLETNFVFLGRPGVVARGLPPESDPRLRRCDFLEDDRTGPTRFRTWLGQPTTPFNVGQEPIPTWIDGEEKLMTRHAASDRLLIFGGGVPAETTGGDVVVTPNDDETATAAIVSTVIVGDTDPDEFAVTFPDDTVGTGANDDIVIVIDDNGGGTHPAISIDADLPPGTTKSVTLENHNRAVCIDDSPILSIDTSGACAGAGVKIKSSNLPDVGFCIDWRPSDQLCMSLAEDLVTELMTIDGLANSAVYALFDTDGDGVEDAADICPGTDLAGPIVASNPNHLGDDDVSLNGCNCTQMIECKPGKNKGEIKHGCPTGLVNVVEQETGWASTLSSDPLCGQ